MTETSQASIEAKRRMILRPDFCFDCNGSGWREAYRSELSDAERSTRGGKRPCEACRNTGLIDLGYPLKKR